MNPSLEAGETPAIPGIAASHCWGQPGDNSYVTITRGFLIRDYD
ncbi:MAG TPA: hypothetical protein VGN90_00255 [Pyrinomonadaceae bacterium]|nr:hypothetical protein [Pyrinomonadaceae bacterium]